jgi:tight adherence protein B
VTPAVVCAVLVAASAWVLGAGRGSVAVRPALLPLAPFVAAAGMLVIDGRVVVALALVVVTAWAVHARRVRRAGRRRTARGVHESCEVLAAELRAGRAPVAALEVAARQWDGLREVSDGFRVGLEVPTTLRGLAARPGADDLRLVAAAWEVGQASGHGLADAMERIAGTLAQRRSSRRLVESELASARTTARMVALLPVVALAMGSGTGSDPWSFLFDTPLGWVCVGAGLLLVALGLGWIELLADRAAPW